MTRQSPRTAHLVADTAADVIDGVLHGLETAVGLLAAYSDTSHSPPIRPLRARLRQRGVPKSIGAVQARLNELRQQIVNVENGRPP